MAFYIKLFRERLPCHFIYFYSHRARTYVATALVVSIPERLASARALPSPGISAGATGLRSDLRYTLQEAKGSPRSSALAASVKLERTTRFLRKWIRGWRFKAATPTPRKSNVSEEVKLELEMELPCFMLWPEM